MNFEDVKKLVEQRGAAPKPNNKSKPVVCPKCSGKGFRQIEKDGVPYVVRCQCHKQQEIFKALQDAQIPSKFWHVTLKNQREAQDGREPFRPYSGRLQAGRGRDVISTESQKRALELCRVLYENYLDAFKNNHPHQDLKGLLLYGDCGRGKTRLACSILVDLIYAGMRNVRFVEYNQLFKLIKFSFKSQETSYQAVFDSLTKARVLVIDDLGTDVGGNLIWVLDNIGYIINERYNMNLPTLITTNFWQPREEEEKAVEMKQENKGNIYETRFSHEIGKERSPEEAILAEYQDMGNRVSYRLRSRIREMCYEYHLEGYDYRNKQARNMETLLAKNHNVKLRE